MTKMKMFFIAMVTGVVLLMTSASPASAAVTPCETQVGSSTSMLNYSGAIVGPSVIMTDAQSTTMQGGYKEGSGQFESFPVAPTGGPGGWSFVLPVAEIDGTAILEVAGRSPDVLALCAIQVQRPISVPTFIIVGKKKPMVVASYDQRRPVTSSLMISQKIKKKGQKTKVVRKSVSAMSARVRPGGTVTVDLDVTVTGCLYGPAVCDVPVESQTLSVPKAKKRIKK